MIKFRKYSIILACGAFPLLGYLALDFSNEFPVLQIVSICLDLLQISNVTNFNIYLLNLPALNTHFLKYLSKETCGLLYEN